MEKTILLSVEDLSVSFKVYGGLARVLDGVSFQVYKGERVGLVGETGCGKTTTLRIMGILAENSG